MSKPSAPVGIDQSELDEMENTYIVMLNPDNSLDSHMDWVNDRNDTGLNAEPEWSDVHKYESVGGYQAQLKQSAIEELRKRSDVRTIVKDRFGSLDMDDNAPANINAADGAPWNLQRLSSTAALDPNDNPKALTYTYRRPEVVALAAKPVHVYVLDTGIMIDHEEFQGRQVFQGPNFSYNQVNNHDTQGHGTHVAGTVGGNQYGVARDPGVRITGVKVTTGHGLTADGGLAVRLTSVIRGLQWVSEQHREHPEIPTIINMSLKFDPAEDALDITVDNAAARGMHVVVSAGNAKKDATSQSPARARGALAVGASTIKDEFWKGSNFGPKVAIFAPGADITSAGIAGPAAHKLDSGTSFASPLVAGTIAWLIQQEGNRSPEAMLQRLQQLADESGRVVTGVPADTTNRLVWNGVR